MDVNLALYIHEDETAGKADGNHHQLGPERPLQFAITYFLRSPVDENVQRPDNTSDGDDVEGHTAEKFAAFQRSHV